MIKSKSTIICSLVLFLLMVNSIEAGVNGTAEVWLRIFNTDGSAWVTSVEVYRKVGDNYSLYGSTISFNYWTQNNSNAYADIDDNNSGSGSLPPLSYNNTYALVVDGKYWVMIIGEHIASPDVTIEYRRSNGSFSVVSNIGGIISFENQGTWSNHDVMVKNSFNTGNVYIDNTLYQNIGAGVAKTWVSASFPHNLQAIDNQSASNFVQRYEN